MRGKLIVFEGISGTGKETQANLLQAFLTKQSINSRVVYHPSPALKQILSQWRRKRHIDRLTEVYLLLADRYDRVRQEILPALSQGTWVISLRNYLSALVYQGRTQKDRQWIAKEFSRFEPRPDYLFFFDVSPQLAFKRIEKRYLETGEAMGKFETKGELRKKNKLYKQVLANIPHKTLDATASINKVRQQIANYLRG